MIDIGDKAQLLEYLRARRIFPDMERVSLVYFSGGVSGVVALASDGEQDVIVKQALSKLKVRDDWRCDPARIITEHKAHEIYARLVPDSVPATLFADAENMVIGRVGAPDGTPMWKSQLLDGLLDFRVARKAIDAMLVIHNASARDAAVLREFDDNAVFYDLRISPYIETVAAAHPDVREQSLPIVDRLMREKLVLNHGDFSPKNILVRGEDIFILDYEVAHAGHPSFDLAFFFNHFLLKSVKNRRWGGAYLAMAGYMAEWYFGRQTVMDAAALERQTAELLSFMLLARVDGKSPAEYIVEEADKEAIRRAAKQALRRGAARLEDVAAALAAEARGGH